MMKTDDTIVAVHDDNGTLIFIKTFDFDTQKQETLDCYDFVRNNFEGLNYFMSVKDLKVIFDRREIQAIPNFEVKLKSARKSIGWQ